MLRDLRWTTAAVVVSRVASFVTVPLLTNALVPAEYGTFRSILLVIGLFVVVRGVLQSSSLLNKHLPELDAAEQARFVSALSLTVITLLTVALLLFLVAADLALFAGPFPAFQGFLTENVVLLGALLFANPLFRLAENVAKGLEAFDTFAGATIAREGAFLVAVAVLFFVAEVTVELTVVALVFADVLGLLVVGTVLGQSIVGRPDFGAVRRQFRRISLPLLPTFLLKKPRSLLPDAIILAVFGPSVFAAWAVLQAFVRLFDLFSRPLSHLFLPKISSRWADDRPLDRVVSQSYRFLFTIAIPLVAGGWLVGEQIIRYIFGSGYLLPWPVLAVMFAAFGVQTVNTISGHFFVGTDRPFYQTITLTLSTVAVLGFAALGGFIFESLLIVSFGYLLENAISFVASLWYQWRVINLSPPSLSMVARVIISLTMMSLIVLMTESLIGGIPSLVSVVALGAVTYFTALLMSGFINERDKRLVREFLGA